MKKSGTIAAAVAGLAVVCLAAPRITGIGGDVKDGEEIVITGTGFGTKANARPLYYWDWGKGRLSTDANSRLAYGGTVRGSLQSSTKVTNSSHALVGPGGAGGPKGIKFTSDKVYMFTKNRYSWAWRSGNNFKHWRLWSKVGYNNIVWGWGDSKSNPRINAERTGKCYYYGSLLYFMQNTWNTEEYWYKTSDLNKANGILRFRRNGQNGISADHFWCNRNTEFPDKYKVFYGDQFQHGSQSSDKAYYDLLYFDDSWARVILSDQPLLTGTGFSNNEIQIPIQWSGTEIKAVVREGTYNQGDTAYLFVVDESGTASPGYKVTIGESGSTKIQPKASSRTNGQMDKWTNDVFDILGRRLVGGNARAMRTVVVRDVDGWMVKTVR